MESGKRLLRTAWRAATSSGSTRWSLAARGRQGLALSVSAVAPKALPVRWDRARIEQLLGNLLENSLRYTDARRAASR